MVDIPLMRAVFRALPTRAALLLVGDVNQLPSVGPGQVLADIIASGAVRVRTIDRREAATRGLAKRPCAARSWRSQTSFIAMGPTGAEPIPDM
jgi:hypothetical protein